MAGCAFKGSTNMRARRGMFALDPKRRISFFRVTRPKHVMNVSVSNKASFRNLCGSIVLSTG